MNRLLIALFLLIGFSSAHATIARLKALGMTELDNEGSYYIDDDRNIFLNPAYAKSLGKRLVTEWGDEGASFTLSSAVAGGTPDFACGGATCSINPRTNLGSDSRPIPNGGAFWEFGNYTAGVYLGNESVTSALLRVLASSKAAVDGGLNNGTPLANTLPTPDNQIDVFLASSMGSMDWGVNFLYYDSDQKETGDAKQEVKGYAARFGAVSDKWMAFALVSFGAESEQTVESTSITYTGIGQDVNHKFEGSLGFHVGGNFDTGMGKVFAYYKSFK